MQMPILKRLSLAQIIVFFLILTFLRIELYQFQIYFIHLILYKKMSMPGLTLSNQAHQPPITAVSIKLTTIFLILEDSSVP